MRGWRLKRIGFSKARTGPQAEALQVAKRLCQVKKFFVRLLSGGELVADFDQRAADFVQGFAHRFDIFQCCIIDADAGGYGGVDGCVGLREDRDVFGNTLIDHR